MKSIIFPVFLLCFLSIQANAAFLSCGTKTIRNIHVQGDRDDGHNHANTLVIQLNDSSCNGREYVYIENTHPAYSAMVTTAMTAYALSKPILVHVNTNSIRGSATQLSILTLSND